MFERIIEKLKAGSKVPKSTEADVTTPCQTIAKPHVSRSLFSKELQDIINKKTQDFIYSVSEKRELFIKECLLKKKVWYTLPNSKIITQLHCNSLYGVKIYRSVFWMNELTPILDTIKNFSSLKENWGSYDEDIISEIAITNSLKLANRIYDISQFIDVFPMRDGGIQFELHSYQNDAEIEISPSGKMSMILFDKELNPIASIFHLSKLRQYLNCPTNFC